MLKNFKSFLFTVERFLYEICSPFYYRKYVLFVFIVIFLIINIICTFTSFSSIMSTDEAIVISFMLSLPFSIILALLTTPTIIGFLCKRLMIYRIKNLKPGKLATVIHINRLTEHIRIYDIVLKQDCIIKRDAMVLILEKPIIGYDILHRAFSVGDDTTKVKVLLNNRIYWANPKHLHLL